MPAPEDALAGSRAASAYVSDLTGRAGDCGHLVCGPGSSGGRELRPWPRPGLGLRLRLSGDNIRAGGGGPIAPFCLLFRLQALRDECHNTTTTMAIGHLWPPEGSGADDVPMHVGQIVPVHASSSAVDPGQRCQKIGDRSVDNIICPATAAERDFLVPPGTPDNTQTHRHGYVCVAGRGPQLIAASALLHPRRPLSSRFALPRDAIVIGALVALVSPPSAHCTAERQRHGLFLGGASG